MKYLLLGLLLLCDQAWGQLYDPTTSGWTQVMDGQDDAVVGIYLNHDFTLYGETFQNVWFSSNGFITFYDPQTDSTIQADGGVYSPDPINDAKWSYMLAPLWADLRDTDTGSGSGFFFQTEETSSTFYWHNVTEDDSYATQNNNYTSTGDTNDFAVVIHDDNSFDFLYDDVNFVTQGFFMGTTGDATYFTVEEDSSGNQSDFYREVSSVGLFYPTYNSTNNTYDSSVNISNFNLYSAASDSNSDGTFEINFNEQPTQKVAEVDCSNPLNDVSCSGYQAAYFDQQCTADPLYDSQCRGYQTAYFDQQCSSDPLYDSQCNGYQDAYFDQQCGISATYSNDCPGYAEAYLYQQCKLDPQYDKSCNGYKEEDDNYGDELCDIDASQSASCSGYYDDQQDDNFYGDGGYGGGGYDGSDDGYDDYSMGDDGNYTTDDDFYGDEGGYGGGYSDAYAGDYDDLGYTDPYKGDDSGYIDPPEYFDDNYGGSGNHSYTDQSNPDPYRDDSLELVFDDMPEMMENGPPPSGGPPPPRPSIDDDFFAGVLPPGPELDAIFMEPEEFERLTPEEKDAKIEEMDEAFAEFEEEMMLMEQDFLEENPEHTEEFYIESEYMLYEESPPPMAEEEHKKNSPEGAPVHHDEPEEIFHEERELERTEAEIIIQEDQPVENEPTQSRSGERSSSANVSIALQASENAVRQAVEVGANLSSAEVIAIDAGQVDTAQAIDYGQQQDFGQIEMDTGDNSFVDTSGHHQEESSHFSEIEFNLEVVIEDTQQQEEEQVEESTFDTSSEAVIDQQFGEQMTQSFATGGNIGTFLSGQSPDFQRFEVKPPEYDVQRDIDVVESSVSVMSTQDVSRQAERLAQQVREGGGFENDQTIAVTVIGYVPGFESYRQDVVDNKREFYKPETVYDGQKNVDDNRTMLFMTQQGDQRHTEMVADQYRR